MHQNPAHVPEDCTLAEWEFDPEGVLPVNHFEHVAETSFELPLDSEELFFVSHGSSNMANGVIEISNSGEPGADSVKVDVLGYFNSQHHFEELTKVCQLRPDDGKDGVGIFAPRQWNGHDHRHRMQFRIHVRLPPSSDGSVVTVNKLRTELPTFVHHVGDLKDTIHFKELSLSTRNTPVHVHSVVAGVASVRSTNGIIDGHFNTSHTLDLQTSNGPISVVLGLFNDNAGEVTKARLQTTNGPINTNVSLFSTTSSGTGGLFDVDTHSSNSPVRVVLPYAPAEHVLTLAARTSNSPVDLVLHPAFEGSFALHGSRWISPQVHVDDGVVDPAGRGRRRQVQVNRISGADVSGSVAWLPAKQREYGSVVASTSNMGVALYL
ncbi:uncharacterized protein C8Q71DRAFT_712850 [Rhodofomes roseus]|uniref:Uncharacterized protein n=1 Tax=Rhodofomes roseus TaxID=34475 RepID=A0ABQ8K8Q6_9APHY|nr:uncharacterized protein C8Q71DRAFT_712850 [Rhodofomes roseus]KAH9833578.1 hypothetical protein C8Q71DRAFT_712850 [Rhodofomes roseus]